MLTAGTSIMGICKTNYFFIWFNYVFVWCESMSKNVVSCQSVRHILSLSMPPRRSKCHKKPSLKNTEQLEGLPCIEMLT